MYLISSSMLKDSIDSLKKVDNDLALDILERDDEVDRLYLLISKQFRAILQGSRLPDTSDSTIDEYHDLRLAAISLERIADHARKIANIASNLKVRIPSDTMEVIESASMCTLKMVEDSFEALYNKDADLAEHVLGQVPNIQKEIDELNKMLLKLDSPEMIVSLGTVVDSIDRIGDYSANISEVAINLSMAISINK